MSNTMDTSIESGSPFPSRAHEFSLCYQWGSYWLFCLPTCFHIFSHISYIHVKTMFDSPLLRLKESLTIQYGVIISCKSKGRQSSGIEGTQKRQTIQTLHKTNIEWPSVDMEIWVIRWIPLLNQEVLSLPEHMNFPSVISGVRIDYFVYLHVFAFLATSRIST
jgi:hypothetical protein